MSQTKTPAANEAAAISRLHFFISPKMIGQNVAFCIKKG
jgi:hypothetical protein